MSGVIKALQLELVNVLQFRYIRNKKWPEQEQYGVKKTRVVFEQTVSTNWIVSRKRHWTNHLNVKRLFRNREDPTEDWFKFDLIKIKVTGQYSSLNLKFYYILTKSLSILENEVKFRIYIKRATKR